MDTFTHIAIYGLAAIAVSIVALLAWMIALGPKDGPDERIVTWGGYPRSPLDNCDH